MNTTTGDGMRYERKFGVETSEPDKVRRLVLGHPAMFRTAFPPRWVNNLYLDAPGLPAYGDNAEGNPIRTKARIRWYGAPTGTVTGAVLEIKHKDGFVGTKERYPLGRFGLDDDTTGRSVTAAVRRIEGLPPATRAAVGRLEEVSANRYRREYYLSSDRRFRATIDTDLTLGVLRRDRGGVRWAHGVRSLVIVEIKYGRDADVDADRVCSWFPFRLSRHSKYARGIEAVTP